jgi:hypothetical protein
MWPPLLDERKYLFLFFLSMKPGFIFIKKIHIIYIYIYKERERERRPYGHMKREEVTVWVFATKYKGWQKHFLIF